MEQNLEETIHALGDALDFWYLHLSDLKDPLQKHVSPAKVANPLEEVVKTAKLVKAHTTKVGILFEKTALKKSALAALKTISELSSTFVLFVSVLAQLSPAEISRLFHREIINIAASLVSNARLLVSELNVLLLAAKTTDQDANADESEVKKEESANENDHDKEKERPKCDTRLMSVGKVWATCDEIVKLIEAGNLRYLEKQTKVQLSLMDDGMDEFSEWAENPEDFDDNDPFGLDDDFSDSEDDTKPPSSEVLSETEPDQDEQDVSESKNQLSKYCKLWLEKFKLVRLLFFSINKSLPLLVAGQSIDQIHEAQELICREIDLLIVDLMLSQVIDHVVEKHAINIDKGCLLIVKVLKSVNEKSPTKVKWCVLWNSKFSELLEEMYEEKS